MNDKTAYEQEKNEYHKEASKILKAASKDSLNPEYLISAASYHESLSSRENEN